MDLDKKLNYSFLKTFGFETFVRINKINRTNLEEKSKKCSYHKITRSRDVIFNENVLHNDKR